MSEQTSERDRTFTVPELSLTITVSPRDSDGLVFVYLDTGDEPADLYDRLRVRINEASLVALDEVIAFVGGGTYGDDLTEHFTDPLPEEEP